MFLKAKCRNCGRWILQTFDENGRFEPWQCHYCNGTQCDVDGRCPYGLEVME